MKHGTTRAVGARRWASVSAFALAASLFICSLSNAQTAVTTCGQEVHDDGMLIADLDCGAAPEYWIEFTKSATFSLNGFTFTGEVRAAVRRLLIDGPGTITGRGEGVINVGVFGHGAQVFVTNATISGNESDGVLALPIDGEAATVRLTDSVVANNGDSGVIVFVIAICPGINCVPRSKLQITRSAVTGNGGWGVYADKLKIEESSISGNGSHGIRQEAWGRDRLILVRDSFVDDNLDAGISAGGLDSTIKVKDSSISRNARGINALSKTAIKFSTLADNGQGITASGRVLVADTTISGTARSGIIQAFFDPNPKELPVVLRNSSVTGSGSDPECGVALACADLDTRIAPLLKSGSNCDSSHDYSSGVPGASWSVCALD
jgi:hypothetical protein